MSIADDLNSIRTHLEDDYEALEQLGVSAEDRNIESIKDMANQIYAKFPKTEYQSGSEVNLGKTIKGKLDFKKEYQEVEYIESTGTQYIDTGVKLSSNHKVEMICKINSLISGNSSYPFFGYRQFTGGVSGNNKFALWTNLNYNIAFNFGDVDTNFISGTSLRNKSKIIFSKSGYYFNDTYIADTSTIEFQNTDTSVIFAIKQADAPTDLLNRGVLMDLYSLKIWSGDTIVRYFIPCYRISDNVIGLYDKVEGKFYTNAGTGTFTKGADVGSGFDEIVGIGQSSQDSTKGYNLAENNLTSKTISGLTVTVNEDKSITINGTATALVQLNLLNNTTDGTEANARTLTAGAYYLSGCPEGSDNGTKFKLDVIRPGMAIAVDTGAGSNPTLSSNQTYTAIRIVIYSGTQCNNLVFKPMLNTGITAKPYEPYTGGQASPSPNWEQEIKYVRGKNLFDISEAQYYKWLYLDGNIGDSGDPNILSEFIKVQKGERYTFSGIPSTYSIRVCSYTSNNVSYFKTCLINNLKNVYTFIADADYIVFAVGSGDTTQLDEIMLEKGSQTTPYLPFNTVEGIVGGKNKANLGTFDIEVVGVRSTCQNQKIKYNGTTTIGGNLLPNGFNLYSLGIFKKGTYTASFHYIGGTYTEPSGVGNAFYFRVPSLGIVINTGAGFIVSGWSRTFTLTEDAEVFIQHYVNGAGMVLDNFEYSIQIEENSTATPFEPYITPETYQFSLGDYEFHGIGNYKDKILCDLENEKVYKKSNTIRYTADELTWSHFSVTQGDLFRTTPIDTIKGTSGYSNYYICKTQSTRTDPCFYVNADNPLIDVIDNRYSDTTNFKNWCVANNVEWIVPRATPTLTEITGTLKDQIIAWCKAHSTNETTIIEMDGDLPLLIEVRGLKGA